MDYYNLSKYSSTACAKCQAKTGGTAFPTCLSVSLKFDSKTKLSGND